jgi:hypothetical protein
MKRLEFSLVASETKGYAAGYAMSLAIIVNVPTAEGCTTVSSIPSSSSFESGRYYSRRLWSRDNAISNIAVQALLIRFEP